MEITERDRRSDDIHMGYLTGRIEILEKRVDSIDQKLDKMLELIQLNSQQLSMYKNLVFFLRTLAICAGALLAANWDTARIAWNAFFSTEQMPGG